MIMHMVRVRVRVRVRVFQRDLVCSRGFLKTFCPVVKGSRVFYNVLGGSNSFHYGYG